MHLSTKELRKMLNKAWDKGQWRTIWQPWNRINPQKQSARYRDASKILKEAIPKPKQWDNLEPEEK